MRLEVRARGPGMKIVAARVAGGIEFLAETSVALVWSRNSRSVAAWDPDVLRGGDVMVAAVSRGTVRRYGNSSLWWLDCSLGGSLLWVAGWVSCLSPLALWGNLTRCRAGDRLVAGFTS